MVAIGHYAPVLAAIDPCRRWLKWTVSFALVLCLFGCGSDRVVGQAHFVCFRLATNDGQAIGSFLQQFFVNGEQLPGMNGYSVQWSNTSRVSVNLTADIHAATWLESLPPAALHDPAVTSYEIAFSDCAAPPRDSFWLWRYSWIVVAAWLAASFLAIVLFRLLIRDRRAFRRAIAHKERSTSDEL